MDTHRSEILFFMAILAITIFLSWMVLSPYISALVLAGTIAFLFHPLYKKILGLFHNESVSAFVTVIIVTLIIFIPVGYFVIRIFGEATTLYSSLLLNGGVDFSSAFNNLMSSNFKEFDSQSFIVNLNDYITQGLSWVIQNFGLFFTRITQTFFTTFLSLLGIFYFLKEGERLKKWFIDIIPLSPKYTESIFVEMENVGSSVVKGTLVVAILQGLVMGLGFLIFHVPNPTFWGSLVVVASIIPLVGTWIVVIPAVLFLFITGQTALSIGLLIWSLVLVNIIYNILSPQLMRRGAHIHPYLILLAVLGGIGLFGPIGFLMGPLVISLLFSLLKIYTKISIKQQ